MLKYLTPQSLNLSAKFQNIYSLDNFNVPLDLFFKAIETVPPRLDLSWILFDHAVGSNCQLDTTWTHTSEITRVRQGYEYVCAKLSPLLITTGGFGPLKAAPL